MTACIFRSDLRSFATPLLGLAAGLLGLLSGASAQAPVYHATYLGPSPHAAAMNDSGFVVGTGTVVIYPRAWVARPGQALTYLPLPLGFLSSGPRDINDAGVIVGVISPYSTTNVYPYPAKWEPNGAGGYTVTLLDLLPGDNRGTAEAINNVGDIVGTSSYQSNFHTVLFTPAGTVNLPGLGSIWPRSLNDQRVYVGGNAGAFRVSLDTLAVENLGFPPGATGAHAWVINSGGQVAGGASLAGPGCTEEPVLYSDSEGWAVVGACGTSSSSYDLNDLGDVLMMIDSVPWLMINRLGTFRVEDLIVADVGHWTVIGGYDIALSNTRAMAVHASNTTTGQSGVVLLTPEGDEVCQTNLGFAGPGALQLSMCGGDLSSGTSSDLLLAGAASSGTAWLLVGLLAQPAPFKGGTLVPLPPALVLPLTVDALGQASIPGIAGGGGPFSVYLQAGMQDVLQPLGWSISNVLRADFLP